MRGSCIHHGRKVIRCAFLPSAGHEAFVLSANYLSNWKTRAMGGIWEDTFFPRWRL